MWNGCCAESPSSGWCCVLFETVTVDFVEWTTPGFCSYVVVAKAGMVFIDRAQEKTNLFRMGTGGAQPQSCLMRAEHGNPVLVRPASVGMAVSRR
jgi:hypothetical protein